MQRYVTLTREQAQTIRGHLHCFGWTDELRAAVKAVDEQTLDDQVGPLTQVAGAPSSPSLRDVQRELEAAHEARRVAEESFHKVCKDRDFTLDKLTVARKELEECRNERDNYRKYSEANFWAWLKSCTLSCERLEANIKERAVSEGLSASLELTCKQRREAEQLAESRLLEIQALQANARQDEEARQELLEANRTLEKQLQETKGALAAIDALRRVLR